MKHNRPTSSARLDGVDLLRGVAIVMMIAYHFCFDLVLFRWAHWPMLADMRWIAWRSVILSSFLLIAGVSLALRAQFRPGWSDFWRRWWQLAGAAVLVTLGSALIFPRTFIYFGVLHHLALMLIVARLMQPLGRWNALIGLAIIMLGNSVGFDAMNPKWINWIGFITDKPATEDYVPIFPWFGVLLIGFALGDHWRTNQFKLPALVQGLRGALPTWIDQTLTLLGRWSLTTYLVHQPILIGLLWLIAPARH